MLPENHKPDISPIRHSSVYHISMSCDSPMKICTRGITGTPISTLCRFNGFHGVLSLHSSTLCHFLTFLCAMFASQPCKPASQSWFCDKTCCTPDICNLIYFISPILAPEYSLRNKAPIFFIFNIYIYIDLIWALCNHTYFTLLIIYFFCLNKTYSKAPFSSYLQCLNILVIYMSRFTVGTA